MDLSQLRQKGDVAPPNSKPQKAASMAERKSEETKRYSADGCLFTLPHVVSACVWRLPILALRQLAFLQIHQQERESGSPLAVVCGGEEALTLRSLAAGFRCVRAAFVL